MFKLIFDAILDYMQLMYLVAGGMCSGIGLLIVGYATYVRLHEHVYAAEVVGVHKDDEKQTMFWPVIAYVDEKGQRHEALANSGSSLIGGRTPGAKTMILADPTSPASPMLMRDWWFLVAIGAIIVAMGYPFIHVGLKNLRFDWTTLATAAAVCVYLSVRIFRFVHPILDARKSGDWRNAQLAYMHDKQQKRADLPLASDVEIATVKAQQTKWFISELPVLAVAGLALLIGGSIWLDRDLTFLSRSVAGEGRVIRNDVSPSSGSSSSYHAVVLFTDRIGRRIEFRDSVGTSPPWYATGDTVKVFYLPNDPGRSMIDRGVWNWLVALLTALGGAVLLAVSAHGYRLYRLRRSSMKSNGLEGTTVGA